MDGIAQRASACRQCTIKIRIDPAAPQHKLGIIIASSDALPHVLKGSRGLLEQVGSMPRLFTRHQNG
jgi:hypothetical protein